MSNDDDKESYNLTTEQRNNIRCPVCAVPWNEHTHDVNESICARHRPRPVPVTEADPASNGAATEHSLLQQIRDDAIWNARYCICYMQGRENVQPGQFLVAQMLRDWSHFKSGDIVLISSICNGNCSVFHPYTPDEIARYGFAVWGRRDGVPLGHLKIIEMPEASVG